jgi:hypothetical protein
MIEKTKRDKLLKAMKMEKMGGRDIDFSLTTENLIRLKEILNRGSAVYLDPTARIIDV